MIELETASLLRRFAEEGDEGAFRELVNRHVGLVYAAAWRQTLGAGHLAEDVTQMVFTLLARQAGKLTAHPTLTGWLFTTTRNCARDAVRAAARRRECEQEIAMHETTGNSFSGEVNWAALAPEIDEALSRLSAQDREGILLRFFENRSYAELGATLGLAENAARMRVERALERLRGELKRRGIASTAALLTAALANQPVVAVPAQLAGQVGTAALASAVAAGAGGVGLATVVEFMKATKITLTLGLLAAGAAIYEGNAARVADRRAAEAERGLAALQAKLAAAQSQAQAADEDNARLLAIAGRVQENATARVHSASAAALPSSAEVNRRFERAQQLFLAGKRAEALAEFLWCYDEGMLGGAFWAQRNFSVVPLLLKLGKDYPPALAALRERAEKAGARMLSDPSDNEAAMSFGQIFHELKEDGRLLQMLATLPPGEARRSLLISGGYDALVGAQRYGDAAAARSFGEMVQSLEMMAAVNIPDTVPNAAESRKSMHASIVKTAVDNFEVLVGSGAAEQAQALAKKLLAYDDTPATRALLAARAAKAGHPEFTTGAAGTP